MGFEIDNSSSAGPSGASFPDNLFQIYDDADPTVTLRFSVNGNAGTNTTIATNQTVNRVITLPDTTDTVLVESFAQNVSNKTIDTTNVINARDSLFTLIDNVDSSKAAQFQVASISAATTRVFTFPDTSDTLVVLSLAQNLTNKTLDNSNIVTL